MSEYSPNCDGYFHILNMPKFGKVQIGTLKASTLECPLLLCNGQNFHSKLVVTLVSLCYCNHCCLKGLSGTHKSLNMLTILPVGGLPTIIFIFLICFSHHISLRFSQGWP